MIGEQQIREILAQYKKHGWILRRVLFCEAVQNPATFFGEIEIVSAEVNALWFSRASGEGREAWELRHLSETPFALIEVFEDEDEEAVREEIRQEMQTELRSRASKLSRQKPGGEN